MKYQLVLKFHGDDEDTTDKVIALEDLLIDVLEGSTMAEVDGHEVGDGVIHLSLLTKNPAKIWEKVEPLVEKAAAEDLEIMAVAYRELEADEYTVLWPTDYEGEFEVG